MMATADKPDTTRRSDNYNVYSPAVYTTWWSGEEQNKWPKPNLDPTKRHRYSALSTGVCRVAARLKPICRTYDYDKDARADLRVMDGPNRKLTDDKTSTVKAGCGDNLVLLILESGSTGLVAVSFDCSRSALLPRLYAAINYTVARPTQLDRTSKFSRNPVVTPTSIRSEFH
ncbi:hypothetical protein J6590_061232 [Homalodisca vitripennis]|nr:hypothetical protein J6590_061232 [Homalodisca vitripennis]